MKRKYFVYVLVVLVALGVWGCSGGNDVVETNANGDEIINGIVVPPAPDPVEDAASVGGVDSNGNIVRDSVERMLAEEFGNDPVFYEQAKAYAIAAQVAIVDPAEENVAAYDSLSDCVEYGSDVLDNLVAITRATTDTEERANAYTDAFAGRRSIITDEGC